MADMGLVGILLNHMSPPCGSCGPQRGGAKFSGDGTGTLMAHINPSRMAAVARKDLYCPVVARPRVEPIPVCDEYIACDRNEAVSLAYCRNRAELLVGQVNAAEDQFAFDQSLAYCNSQPAPATAPDEAVTASPDATSAQPRLRVRWPWELPLPATQAVPPAESPRQPIALGRMIDVFG